MDYLAIAIAGAALIAAAAALVLAWQAKQLSAPERVDQLEALITQQAPSEILTRIETDLAKLHRQVDGLEEFAQQINRRLDTAIQRVGLSRFNSSDEIGGELSFALTLLDVHNHGMIITALTDHRGSRVFIRGIVSGEPQHPLLDYEKTSLQQALNV